MALDDETVAVLTTAFASECVTSALCASLLRSHEADYETDLETDPEADYETDDDADHKADPEADHVTDDEADLEPLTEDWFLLAPFAALIVGLTIARPAHAHLWHRLLANLDLGLPSASKASADAELRRLWRTPEFARAYLGYELAHPDAPSLYDFLPSIGVAVPASALPVVEAMLEWADAILCEATLAGRPEVPPPDWFTVNDQIDAILMQGSLIDGTTAIDIVVAVVSACLRSVNDAGGPERAGPG